MFLGDPIGHCYKTMAPKLKSEKEMDTKSGEERLQPSLIEKNDEVKGVKRDSSGAVISLTTKSVNSASCESPDQEDFDPHLSSDDRLVGQSVPKAEDQARVVGLQVRKHLVQETRMDIYCR